MTQQQVYDIVVHWVCAPEEIYAKWRQVYNWTPPNGPSSTTVWAAAGDIAAVYTGPVIT